MDRVIKEDLFRYIQGDYNIWRLLRGLKIPGFRFMYFLRRSAKARKGSVLWIINRIILRRYSYKFGYQIPYYTKIGEGFYIGHFGFIVIHGSSIIGRNCNIAHGVTIGEASRGKLKGVPRLGDYVWIGTNAIIVGNISIGSHVLIAPGAFVNFDVPDHSMVIGNPGKILRRQNPTEGYICNYLR